MGLIKKYGIWAAVIVVIAATGAILAGQVYAPDRKATVAPAASTALNAEPSESDADADTEMQAESEDENGAADTVKAKTLDELVQLYGELPLIDAHNHDAGGGKYRSMLGLWEKRGIDGVVLFGGVSDPAAQDTDKAAWEAYQQHPDMIIPFTSGINLLEEEGVEQLRSQLEKGYFGLGEIAGASSHSPVLASAKWKTKHPMDGILPELYALCAEYEVPILMHIDPPNGEPIQKLEEALEANPDTTIIFAHANAFNSPANVERLLEKYPNLYADFFAGFTVFNPQSTNTLEDFVPVIRKFPDRFVLSTDSGFGIGSEEQAIEAVYRLIDALDDPVAAEQVAFTNMNGLIQRQPATKTQLEAISRLGAERTAGLDLASLSKREAGGLLIEGNAAIQ